MTWTIGVEIDPDRTVRAAILAPLTRHNVAAAGETGFETIAITVRGDDGQIVGGLWGYTLYRYLFVELLAMGDAKGEGVGREVMAQAEAEARRRGCIGMWLDTFTFQAPDFYAKLGFVEFGRMADYPPGHDRLFLVKRFDPNT